MTFSITDRVDKPKFIQPFIFLFNIMRNYIINIHMLCWAQLSCEILLTDIETLLWSFRASWTSAWPLALQTWGSQPRRRTQRLWRFLIPTSWARVHQEPRCHKEFTVVVVLVSIFWLERKEALKSSHVTGDVVYYLTLFYVVYIQHKSRV